MSIRTFTRGARFRKAVADVPSLRKDIRNVDRPDAKELHAAHAKYGLTRAEFEGPKFQRIAHIRQLLADGILDETLRHTTTVGSPS